MYKEEPFDYEASSHYETPGSSAPQTSEVAQNEAEYNPSIYGTEKDKVNCSFYYKIGACRHGDKCSRIHNIPTRSRTIIMKNLYHNPVIDMRQADAFSRVGGNNKEEQKYFDEFYEELFVEIDKKYGRIHEMNVCDNIGEHMIGNVYVKFYSEKDAERCIRGVENRWFNGEPIYAELSPVRDFREALCRQYETGGCKKGAFCNFMHLKPISRELYRQLYGRDRVSPDRGRIWSDRDRNRGSSNRDRDRGSSDRDRDRGSSDRDRNRRSRYH